MKLVFQLNSNALLLPTYVTYVVVMPLVRRRRGDGSLQVRGPVELAARWRYVCDGGAHFAGTSQTSVISTFISLSP